MKDTERFAALPEYPFARLRALLDPHPPGADPLAMSIGEPTHAPPAMVGPILAQHLDDFRRYPPNDGTPELRAAIGGWITRRYGAELDADRQILPLNGSREGLFAAGLALVPRGAVVLIPTPFYQPYAAAALAAGAEPVFVPAGEDTGFLPDFAALAPETLARTALAYMCSPANPQGVVADAPYWRGLIELAERHDFRILADECYSEIYRDTAPTGLLSVAGDTDPERVLLVNSLSKRSNLPGLRSGFIAGGPEAIDRLKALRAFGGAPLPLPVQHVSEAVWSDEAHVVENRRLYGEKYALADEILGGMPGYSAPQAGFFLWLKVADGEAAALRLWREAGLRVLPGAYLSRAVDGHDPARDYIRVALVAPLAELRAGLERLRAVLTSQKGA